MAVSSLNVAPTRANSTIVDLFVLYSDRYAGWMPVSAIVDLVRPLGVTETNARASLSRLAKATILQRASRRGLAGYEPAGTWGELLPEAHRYLRHRIFDGPPPLSEGWALVNFSFPETARADRHLLRALLTKEGFGCVSSGLWIFPGGELDRVVLLVRSTGLEDNVTVFRAQHHAFGPVREFVEQAWDLDAVAASFEDFLATFTKDRTRPTDTEAAFTTWTLAHNQLRHLVGSCPSLPAEVLPKRWPATEAMRVMRGLSDRLALPAAQYVDEIVASRTTVRV